MKVALAIVLGLGPIFIALLLFDATKKFFEAWLGQALNYMFVFALVASAVNILFALWMPALRYAQANNTEGFTALLPMLLMGGVAFVVLMQIPGDLPPPSHTSLRAANKTQAMTERR